MNSNLHLLRGYSSALCLLALLSLTAAAQLPIVPTTTLAAETANNTSAPDTFRAQRNGNAAARNLSKLSIRNLLYSGSNTKIYAAVMPWFGRADHMSIGYTSSDPGVIRAQVDDMLSRGIQGAIIPWYGPNVEINSATAVNYMSEAESRGGSFEFSIMIDVGALGAAATHNNCDVTAELAQDLSFINSTFENSPAYTRINGRPVVYFFGVEAYYIDWDQVRSSVPGNPLFLMRNAGGFAAAQSNGAYSWVEISADPYDMVLGNLDSFFAAAGQHLGAYEVGEGYKGFNDTLAAWSANRVMDQQCGRTWLRTFSEINNFHTNANPLPAVQLVTWNDYEEGTEMETGIDNCAAVNARVSGATLNWSLDFASSLGTESTVDHYTVFISTDGENLMPLADVPSGAHSLDLSQYPLTPANYRLYVKAVGLPSIVNHISPAVSFNPNNRTPSASLSVNSSGPLSATASGTASDPDGSIASASIDFGDGAVLPGLNATHVYQNPGQYRVTLTVTDNAGLSASTGSYVTVSAGPGVVIVSPASGTLNSPVHVLATGSMANPVTAMAVQVDGSTIYWTANSVLDAFLKIVSGTHNLTVTAEDGKGAVGSSSVTVNTDPGNAPPSAGLTVNPFGGGNQVLACTATSSDSDGFIGDSLVNFGDGTTTRGPMGLHTYGAPGTYTVTATVTDNLGLTSTTSSRVTVPGMGPPPPAPPPARDFALSLNATSATVKAGQAATLSASVSSLGGFSDAVGFFCTGLPSGAGCSFSPSAVTPGANGRAATTLTITTQAATAASLSAPLHPGSTLALSAPFFAIVLAGFGSRRTKRQLLLLAGIVLVLLALPGCGGGARSTTPTTAAPATPTPTPTVTTPGTPAGAYTIAIIATTSGASPLTHSQAVTLNVQ